MVGCELPMRVAWLLSSLGVLAPLAASAAPAPKQSALERATVERVLRERWLELEPNPAGAIIESVALERLEIFDETDPVPDLFNVFHTTTKAHVIERELLFDAGQRWDDALVAESARNLRGKGALSLVIIVPVKGSAPGRVRALVITKDVWSLRLSTSFQYYDGMLTQLTVQPSEINLLGLHALAALNLGVRPDTYSFGMTLGLPRVAGSRITSGVSGNVILNREEGHPEGSFGSFSYGKPLYALSTRWSWQTYLAWRTEVFRSYIGRRLRTYDAPSTPGDDAIPWAYDAEHFYGQLEITRSFGDLSKLDVSFGVEATRQAFRTRDLPASPARRDFVSDVLPVRDTRQSPYFQLRTYDARYATVLDVNTLGLQEDVHLGHDLLLRTYPALAGVGSSRRLIGMYASAAYTVPLGNGFARALATAQREYARYGREDGFSRGALRVVTPSFGFGRLLFDAELLVRDANFLNERSTLGGDTRLRGYAPAQFLGSNLVVTNLELRTRPVQVLSAQLGGAAFHDVGSTFETHDALHLRQSIGLGLRLVLPQFDRSVIRADWGFPLNDPTVRGLPGSLFISFGQAAQQPIVTPPANFAQPSAQR